MSAPLSDWLMDRVREALATAEATSVADGLAMVRSQGEMQRVLRAIVDSADLERAA